jgi:predicted transcriptional regulator
VGKQVLNVSAVGFPLSQKSLYALQALISLAGRYDGKSATKIHDIAAADGLPEKFLELILLELKHARIVESVRGAKGGYRLKRRPTGRAGCPSILRRLPNSTLEALQAIPDCVQDSP